jgi:hypothetical protein
MKRTVFSDSTRRSSDSVRRFGETLRYHLQGRRIFQPANQHKHAGKFNPKD